ncbi:MAG: hypothetical protein ACYC4Q_07740 [Victivallaceae bacterium]
MNKLMGLIAVGMFGLGISNVIAQETAPAPNSDQPPKKEMKERGGERRGGPGREADEFGPGDKAPGREMGRPGGDNQRMMDRMLQKYPKEMEEIKKLRESDPEAAREKFQELAKKVGEEMKAEREKMQAERKKFMEMVKAYQKDKDPKALEEIKAKITEQMTQRLEEMKKKIEQDENNIKERKAKYDELSANKDKEIAKRLERITTPPKMD